MCLNVFLKFNAPVLIYLFVSRVYGGVQGTQLELEDGSKGKDLFKVYWIIPTEKKDFFSYYNLFFFFQYNYKNPLQLY